MIPLVAAGFRGHAVALFALPLGIAASTLLAIYVGGERAVFEGVLPTMGLVLLLGK